jgi:hypothetical protein
MVHGCGQSLALLDTFVSLKPLRKLNLIDQLVGRSDNVANIPSTKDSSPESKPARVTASRFACIGAWDGIGGVASAAGLECEPVDSN